MQRQRLLFLYLQNSALDSAVLGWSRYDGDSSAQPVLGELEEAPYATELDALRDGWRLIQMSQLAPQPNEATDPGWMSFEAIFERLVDLPRDQP